MTQYAMFLASNAAHNLDVAITNRVWGWTDLVLDHPGQIHSGMTGRERVEALKPGDTLLIATGRPGASVTRRYDPNRIIVLERVVECRITESLYSDRSSVWEPAPDIYSNRVRFEVISQRYGVESGHLSPPVMIALTDSLNRSGTPFPAGSAGMGNPSLASVFVEPPPRTIRSGGPSGSTTIVGPNHDYELDAQRRKSIGDRGEQFVVATERHRLQRAGRADLADRVEHVSNSVGDGLGYDVLSFDETTGSEMHIEVKTTVGPITEPFPITAAEVRYSIATGATYRLYRVFNLESAPQIFVMTGDLEKQFDLTPIIFMAKR